MLKASWAPYTLRFRETAITSRARMLTKDTYIIKVWHSGNPEVAGWGECALFRGLSAEDTPAYEEVLNEVCRDPQRFVDEGFPAASSIRFGFEVALADLRNGGVQRFFNSSWTKGASSLKINGLIWMGSKHLMLERIKTKLADGFGCVKLKIGGIDFDEELSLLEFIRKYFSAKDIELRVDANGAFAPEDALRRLDALARYDIHSIEQPIKAGQPEAMARIVERSAIPIALDEELIGVTSQESKRQLLKYVRPHYIILKPSLCGGLLEADKWISEAEANGVGWWATSALESDLGLAAIGQWVSQYSPALPQGLGTGRLYTNNFKSPLHLEGQYLGFDPGKKFEFPDLRWQN